jgi:hypothetical protein
LHAGSSATECSKNEANWTRADWAETEQDEWQEKRSTRDKRKRRRYCKRTAKRQTADYDHCSWCSACEAYVHRRDMEGNEVEERTKGVLER